MGRIIITRADEVLHTLRASPSVTAVLSIEHPGAVEGGKGYAPRLEHPPIVQTVLCFYDTEDSGAQFAPDREQVERGIVFALENLPHGDVIVHCHAGKCRSTALALGIMAAAAPAAKPEDLVETLLQIREGAAPNMLVLKHAEDILGLSGRLTEAVKAHPVIAEYRARTRAAREAWAARNPDHVKRMYPRSHGGV